MFKFLHTKIQQKNFMRNYFLEYKMISRFNLDNYMSVNIKGRIIPHKTRYFSVILWKNIQNTLSPIHEEKTIDIRKKAQLLVG
jgi:hypothetical protein